LKQQPLLNLQNIESKLADKLHNLNMQVAIFNDCAFVALQKVAAQSVHKNLPFPLGNMVFFMAISPCKMHPIGIMEVAIFNDF
jgi:hypothetical protein